MAIRPASFEGDDWLGLIGRPPLRVRDIESVDGAAVHHCMALFNDWVMIDFSVWPTAVATVVGNSGRLPDEFAGGVRVRLD